MKLNPNLKDWWTEKKRTDLSLSKDKISGAGISLKVILNIVLNKNNRLYSYEGGVHEDNLYILIIKKESHLDKKLPKILRKKSESRLREWFGETIQIEEFIINKKGMELLKVKEEREIVNVLNEDIKYNVYFHDNFIFSMSLISLSNEVIINIIERIKYLHNFYLDSELKIKGFEERVYELLKTKESISLISNPENGKLKIEYKTRSINTFKRLFNFQDKEEIILN